MREIKFRAWDKKEKKMRTVNSISFHSECDCFDYDISHLPKVFNLWGYDIISQEPMLLHREENEVVLLQYTGLKDKNGKEIYGGDIVEVSTLGINYKRDYIKGVVESIDGCYTVTFLSPVYDVTLKVQRKSLYVKCFTVNQDIKVIGNIYENHND